MMNNRFLPIAMIIIGSLCAIGVGAQSFPRPQGYVNDFAGIISSRDELQIRGIAEAIEKATTIEIGVVTVKTMAPYGSIEQYSIDLASAWEIGKKGEDNGLLLVVALEERETRIEVGYGLEGIFPDGLVGRIMDTSMIPYFRRNDFSTGLAKAVEGVAGVISREYNVDFSNVSRSESEKYTRSSRRSGRSYYPYISFIVIFLLGGGRFFWPMLMLGGMGGRRHYRGGFGMSSRGGFGSRGGGFSGFGGGGFGGGGASRSF